MESKQEYVKSIEVVAFAESSQISQSSTFLNEKNGKSRDLNGGQGGHYTYLKVSYTTVLSDAASGFKLLFKDQRTPGLGTDYTAGSSKNSDHRYVLTEHEGGYHAIGKDDIFLWRSGTAETPTPSGYRKTGDLNYNRGGDYLYLIWKPTIVGPENATELQFWKDFGVCASILARDKELFKRTFNFLYHCNSVQEKSVAKAKARMRNVIKSVEAEQEMIKKVGDASDGVGIVAGVFGIFGVLACVFGQPEIGMPLLYSAGAFGAASMETGIYELVKTSKLKEHIQGIEQDAKKKLAYNHAMEAHESMSALEDLKTAYDRNGGTKLQSEDFYMQLAAMFDEAMLEGENDQTKSRKAMQKLLEDYEKEYKGLKSLPELTDDQWIELLDWAAKSSEENAKSELKQFLTVEASFKIPEALIGLFARKSKTGKRTLNRWFIKKGLPTSTLRAPKIFPEKEMEVLAKNAKKAPRTAISLGEDTGQFGKMVQKWNKMSKLGKIASHANVLLESVGLGLSIWSLVERAKTTKDLHDNLQEALDSFSDAMDSVLEFQRLLFPRPIDHIKSALNTVRKSQLETCRKTLKDRFDSGESHMGMIIDNRSKYTFDVFKTWDPCWRGKWNEKPKTLIGWEEVAEKVKENATYIHDRQPRQVDFNAGWSAGNGFSGIFLLNAKGNSNIQIPLWYFYAYNKPYEVMCAFANIPGWYTEKDNDAIWNHINDYAAPSNKVHAWSPNGGGSRSIQNGLLRITVSVDQRVDVVIEDNVEVNL